MFRSLFQCSKASYTFPIRKQMKANCNSAVWVQRRETKQNKTHKTKQISWECVLSKALQMISKLWLGFCKGHSYLKHWPCAALQLEQSRTGQVTCNCGYQHCRGALQTANNTKLQGRPCCYSVSAQPACAECPAPHGTANSTVLEFWQRPAVPQ